MRFMLFFLAHDFFKAFLSCQGPLARFPKNGLIIGDYQIRLHAVGSALHASRSLSGH